MPQASSSKPRKSVGAHPNSAQATRYTSGERGRKQEATPQQQPQQTHNQPNRPHKQHPSQLTTSAPFDPPNRSGLRKERQQKHKNNYPTKPTNKHTHTTNHTKPHNHTQTGPTHTTHTTAPPNHNHPTTHPGGESIPRSAIRIASRSAYDEAAVPQLWLRATQWWLRIPVTQWCITIDKSDKALRQ